MNYKFFFFTCALNLFYYVPNLLASPVIGGDEDTFNTHKYHVSIRHGYYHGNPNSGKFLCGGSIIHDRYVLTAAHCFMIKTNGHIEAILQPRTSGVIVLAGTSETYGPGIITDVCKVFIPHAYNQGPEKYGDIAIAELAVSLNVADNYDRLQILRLDPGHPLNFYENKNALVPGNGCDAIYRGDDGVFLPQPNRVAERRQILEVHMVEKSLCPDFDYSICALPLDRSHIRTCSKGDSGSPLVYKNTIIGVLRQTPKCFLYDWCGMVFTRVSIFTDFIMNAKNNQYGDHSQMYILDD